MAIIKDIDTAGFVAAAAKEVDAALERWLPGPSSVPGIIHESMRWSALAPGKRLRPALLLAAGRACGADSATLLPSAAALELIHAFSLVHDDLPAMDDDDLRRGLPTNHVRFGEATAILAGDALACLAFEIIARETPQQDLVAPLIVILGRATGTQGMIGGQVLDLLAEGSQPNIAAVEEIHRRKTAALIRASCEMGAVCARADAACTRAMVQYGERIGIAFQITDDLLDITATAEQVGKRTRKDLERGKLTWPRVVGEEVARQDAQRLVQEAVDVITPHDPQGVLRALALFITGRNH
ncbi:MAG: polyprenyl synthetase family protein [Planctomycetes bacterium]|nr:polyprenyl synthetase family protein [Planctomycetota bacterium]